MGSAGLDPLARSAPEREPVAAGPLEAVFSRLRASELRQAVLAGAEAALAEAMAHQSDGRIDESIPLLTLAAETPQLRFGAASMLGRIYRERGDAPRAAEWLERASQAPPPTPDEGRLLLYDLADVLEAAGEHTRALTVYMELQADADAYRDVADRVRRLAVVQMRG
ncbi:MAG: tetratricopeptide repeat protein [Acidimicrobiia bacterium]|nr:tetratricopeptide repeat protein [Acidimicrobiia bacterium]